MSDELQENTGVWYVVDTEIPCPLSPQEPDLSQHTMTWALLAETPLVEKCVGTCVCICTQVCRVGRKCWQTGLLF